MEQYPTPWITCIDLEAHLKASLGLDPSPVVGGPFLLLLFPETLKPTKTTLTVNKMLLRQTSVTLSR